jgi:Ca2+-transporting ATPase
MFFGGAAFSVSDISGLQWGVSIILGLVAIPLGALIRCVPNGPFEKLAERMKFIRKKPVLPTETPNQEKNEWQNAMEVVKDNLNTFSSIRGGRLRSSSIVRKSRTSRPQEMTLCVHSTHGFAQIADKCLDLRL